MKKIAALVVCLLAISVFAAAQSAPKIRQKTFEKVWKTVNEKYFDPEFGGVDWKEIRARYAPLAERAKTDAEFDELINKMLGEIRTSHLEIISTETLAKLKAPGATTGLSLHEIDNEVVITRRLANSSAAKSELKTGFVVKKIDGALVQNLTDARQKLQGAPGTTFRLSYADEKDELRDRYYSIKISSTKIKAS